MTGLVRRSLTDFPQAEFIWGSQKWIAAKARFIFNELD
jgi:hypothetical protein